MHTALQCHEDIQNDYMSVAQWWKCLCFKCQNGLYYSSSAIYVIFLCMVILTGISNFSK